MGALYHNECLSVCNVAADSLFPTAMQVDCRTRLGKEWSGPSERLARMMQRQDGNLVQRLKGYVESASQSVPVC